MTDQELMNLAQKARESAYAPYSSFHVGAALLAANGKVYVGCNIENSSFGPTVCAERVAFFEAVKNGERDFVAIAVTGGKSDESPSFCAPCGVCRQVMAEFCHEDFRILLGNAEGIEEHSLGEMLPLSFTLK